MPFYKSYFGSNVETSIVYSYLRPAADDVDGGWTDHLGGTNLAAQLDETSRSDADYIQSSVGPVDDVARVTFGGGTYLDGSKPIKVGYTAYGEGADLVVRLKQGAVTIATWTHTGTLGASPALFEQTLSSGERAAVNWNSPETLKLEFEADSAVWTSPQSDIDHYGGLWFDAQDLSSGAVASWTSREGHANVVAQSTGTAQPSKSGTGSSAVVTFDGGDVLLRTGAGIVAKFVRRVTVPDGLGMPPGSTGKGVTCTGLCRIPGTTQFWMGNHGDASASRNGSGPYTASLIRFDYSGGIITKLQEINCVALLPGLESIQGVTFDTSDNTLWFASANAAGMLNVYHVTQSGTLLGDTITPSWAPNGVAYVPGEDALWICQNPSSGGQNMEKRSCSTGALIVSPVNTATTGLDMLHYDVSTGGLILSNGDNTTAGQLEIYGTSGTSGAVVNFGDATLDVHVDCIEGIVWEGRKVYVVSDGYYHSGSDGLNQLVEYDICPPIANVVSIHMTASVTSVPSGTDCFIEIGGGSDGPVSGFGVGIYPASTTTLTVAGNTAASGSAQRGIITGATVSSLLSTRLIDVIFDVPNDLLTLRVDGTQVTTASLSALVGGLSVAGLMRFGSSMSARLLFGTIKDVIVVTGPSDYQKMEGYRAWRWGLEGSLPVGHPYKSAPP